MNILQFASPKGTEYKWSVALVKNDDNTYSVIHSSFMYSFSDTWNDISVASAYFKGIVERNHLNII